MQCPKCKKDINIGKQLKEADKDFYKGIEPPILLMISCDHCEDQVAMLDIIPIEGFEEIECGALGKQKVRIPKIKYDTKRIKNK